MNQIAVDFLHDELDNKKHTKDSVRAVIRACPDALVAEDKNSDCRFKMKIYGARKLCVVSVMYEEGEKLNIVSEG